MRPLLLPLLLVPLGCSDAATAQGAPPKSEAPESSHWLGCSKLQTPRAIVVVDRWAFAWFDPGSARIKARDMALLDNFVSTYDAPPTCPVEVSGYSDLAEAKSTDMSLSRRRAEAVARYLRRKGLAAPIRIQGFGGTRPLVETREGVAEPQNRYVQVSVDDSQPLPPNSSAPAPRQISCQWCAAVPR